MSRIKWSATLLCCALLGAVMYFRLTRPVAPEIPPAAKPPSASAPREGSGGAARATPAASPIYPQPRRPIDTSGMYTILPVVTTWKPDASLDEISRCWELGAERAIGRIDNQLAAGSPPLNEEMALRASKASCLLSAGKPEEAYAVLSDARALLGQRTGRDRGWILSSFMYLQGVAGLRQGENDNCILCRGESSCIIPISASAVHQHPAGSRLAIQHFRELLAAFPDDLEARWLLNVAHMTLGEHPDKVDPQFLISLDRLSDPEFDVG